MRTAAKSHCLAGKAVRLGLVYVDAHGTKQAARIFAKVLAHVETRGAEAVAKTLEAELAKSEPLLLALAPPPPLLEPVSTESLPATLRVWLAILN